MRALTRSILFAATFALPTLDASEVRADYAAYDCRAPRNVEPITQDGACVGFTARDAQGKVVQHIDKLARLSGSILATRDGTTVAMLNDYPSTQGLSPTSPGLVFFRGGKAVATHTITALVQRMQLVTHSVSHVRWVQSFGARDLVLDKALELVTTSQRAYVFDGTTGAITRADDTNDWKTCDLIVYAAQKVPEQPAGVFTLDQPRWAKGRGPKPLALRAQAGVNVTSGATMCVTKSGAGFLAVRNLPVMFNALRATP